MSVRHDVMVATVLLALSGLAACGAGEGTAAPSTTRTVTVTASTAEAPEPSGPASATDQPSASPTASPTGSPTDPPNGQGVVEAEPTGEQVFLVDARVGSHEGYDRVVWELAGDGTPGYRVGWTDDPRRDGSGEAVDLPGDATLQVVLVGVGIPPDAPAGITPYDGPQTLSLASTTVVTEVEVGGIFEGYLTGFVGAEQERPFEVVLLSGPTRVVVDVRH